MSGCGEARWLAHVDSLIELPIEVHVLEIDLVNLQSCAVARARANRKEEVRAVGEAIWL